VFEVWVGYVDFEGGVWDVDVEFGVEIYVCDEVEYYE